MMEGDNYGDSVESSLDSVKAYGYGRYAVSPSHDSALKFNYQRKDYIGLLRTDINICSSITEAGVIVLGEGNLSFSFSLAAFFQSWIGIMSTLPNKVEDPRAAITAGYELTKRSCEDNQRLHLLRGQDVDSVLSQMLLDLNLPLLREGTVRAPYQHMKREITNLILQDCVLTGISRIESIYDMADPGIICDDVDPYDLENSKVAGDCFSRNLWFQCPWKGPGDQRSNASYLLNFLNQAATCQQSGRLVMIGVINLFPFCTQYGLMDLLAHPSYEFVGYDDQFIRELILLGYKFQSRYVIDGAEFSHITLIFRKRGE